MFHIWKMWRIRQHQRRIHHMPNICIWVEMKLLEICWKIFINQLLQSEWSPINYAQFFKWITPNPQNEMIKLKRDFKYFWCGLLIMCDISQLLIPYLYRIFIRLKGIQHIPSSLKLSTWLVFHGNHTFFSCFFEIENGATENMHRFLWLLSLGHNGKRAMKLSEYIMFLGLLGWRKWNISERQNRAKKTKRKMSKSKDPLKNARYILLIFGNPFPAF